MRALITEYLGVEQNVVEALSISDRAYVLQAGRIVLEGKGEELLKSDLVRKACLGMQPGRRGPGIRGQGSVSGLIGGERRGACHEG